MASLQDNLGRQRICALHGHGRASSGWIFQILDMLNENLEVQASMSVSYLRVRKYPHQLHPIVTAFTTRQGECHGHPGMSRFILLLRMLTTDDRTFRNGIVWALCCNLLE